MLKVGDYSPSLQRGNQQGATANLSRDKSPHHGDSQLEKQLTTDFPIAVYTQQPFNSINVFAFHSS